MRLGCHLSIAGGHHNALLRARELGLECVAMFIRNQRQWKASPLKADAIELFRKTRRETGLSPVVGHASYLINLAGSGDFLEKSIDATVDELSRCGQLGVDYYVIHPGSSTDAQGGMTQIAELLSGIVKGLPEVKTKVLLESTAGQGSCVGCSFEQLAAMLGQLKPAKRFGVCLDTCHVFATGYDVRTPEAYQATMAEFDRVVGLDRLLAVHANDSKREAGSCVDRHAHIGQGHIGADGIANFVNDPRLADVPFILETPKGTGPDGRDLDEMNVATMRGLVR